jgi:hypothetical protein
MVNPLGLSSTAVRRESLLRHVSDGSLKRRPPDIPHFGQQVLAENIQSRMTDEIIQVL